METKKISLVELISLAVSIVALAISVWGNVKAQEANKLAEEANKYSEEANYLVMKSLPSEVKLVNTDFDLEGFIGEDNEYYFGSCTYKFSVRNEAHNNVELDSFSVIATIQDVEFSAELDTFYENYDFYDSEVFQSGPVNSIQACLVTKEIVVDDLDNDIYMIRPKSNFINMNDRVINSNQEKEFYINFLYRIPSSNISIHNPVLDNWVPLELEFFLKFSNGDILITPKAYCHWVNLGK